MPGVLPESRGSSHRPVAPAYGKMVTDQPGRRAHGPGHIWSWTLSQAQPRPPALVLGLFACTECSQLCTVPLTGEGGRDSLPRRQCQQGCQADCPRNPEAGPLVMLGEGFEVCLCAATPTPVLEEADVALWAWHSSDALWHPPVPLGSALLSAMGSELPSRGSRAGGWQVPRRRDRSAGGAGVFLAQPGSEPAGWHPWGSTVTRHLVLLSLWRASPSPLGRDPVHADGV